MGYAVTRPVGTTDAESQEYIRLLRQRGVDIGCLPRVLEPKTGKRWLHVWTDRAAAQELADELNQQTANEGWEVTEVEGPSSDGPLGPLIIQMIRQPDELTFALHPMSRALIRAAFPAAVGNTTAATIDHTMWANFQRDRGGIAELVREIAPGLTGLDREQLEAVGYAVIDADSEKTVWANPPAAPAHV